MSRLFRPRFPIALIALVTECVEIINYYRENQPPNQKEN